jgi:hypothetical protein
LPLTGAAGRRRWPNSCARLRHGRRPQAGRTWSCRFDNGACGELLRCGCASRGAEREAAEAAGQEAFCVLFLEDMREVQARQRTRQACGHGPHVRRHRAPRCERRRPSQANQLLAEDVGRAARSSSCRRWSQENVRACSGIVGDVLEVRLRATRRPGRAQLDAREPGQDGRRPVGGDVAADAPGGRRVLRLDPEPPRAWWSSIRITCSACS